MANAKATNQAIKDAVKEAVAESLCEQRELLHEVLTEVLEDFALAESIREGRKSAPVSRDAVMRALRSKE